MRLFERFSDLAFVQTSKRLAVEKRGWRAGAKAQAIDRLDGQIARICRSFPRNAKLAENFGGELLASHTLAGFAAAKLQQMRPARLGPKIVVECDDTVYFRAGEIEGVRDERHGLRIDTAKFFQQAM